MWMEISICLGFGRITAVFYGELTEYQEILRESVDCFQEKDFEKAYQEAAGQVAKAWKPLRKKPQQQITEWKQ